MTPYHKGWYKLSVLLFVFAALVGVVLRFAFVKEIPNFNYKNALLSHSHLALLGWIHLAILNFVLHSFLPDNTPSVWYRNNFLATTVAAIGLSLTLFFGGLNTASASLFLAFLLVNMIISVSILRKIQGLRSFSLRWLRRGLYFLLLSYLGSLVLIGMILTGAPKVMLFYLGGQFFLHFQINGWFTFALFALFFRFFESKGIEFDQSKYHQVVEWFSLSAFLTFALSVAWSSPSTLTFSINSTGVIVQLIAVTLLLLMMYQRKEEIIRVFDTKLFVLVRFFFFCFVGKVVVQSAVVIPYLAEIAYTIRNYVIAFLHLILIGFLSVAIITYQALHSRLLDRKIFGLFIVLFVFSFLTTEILLVGQGSMFWMAKGFIPYYYELLFASSLVFPLALMGYLLALVKESI